MSALTKVLVISVPVALCAAATLWWFRRRKSGHFVQVGHVSALYVYPVKSCKAVEVNEAFCLSHGFLHDRNWALIDKGNRVVVGSQHPTLQQVEASLEDDHKILCLNAPGMDTLTVNLPLDNEVDSKFSIYTLDTGGQFAGEEASAWFSNYLKKPGISLYKIRSPCFITDNRTWGDKGKQGEKTGYGNLAPYLIATEASLLALNNILPKSISMKRFRPNIVISGMEAWAEDDWKGKRVRIGDVEFRVLKNCGRCLFTTVDPETGQRDGNEPVTTLRRTRLPADRDKRYGMDPFFGVYMVPRKDTQTILRIGDPVMVMN